MFTRKIEKLVSIGYVLIGIGIISFVLTNIYSFIIMKQNKVVIEDLKKATDY